MGITTVEILVFFDDYNEEAVVKIDIPDNIAGDDEKRRNYICDWLDKFMPLANEWREY